MQNRRRIIDDQLHAHYVTFSVFRRRRLHDHPKRVLLGVLNGELQRHQASCIGFVVMPDHVHAIIWFCTDGKSKLEEKVRYMHENPVRRGLVQRATDRKWSSTRSLRVGTSGRCSYSMDRVSPPNLLSQSHTGSRT